MKSDPFRSELQSWTVRRIAYIGLIFGAIFAGVQALWDPGWTALLLRFLGASIVFTVYLFLIRRYPRMDSVLNLISIPSTIIIATIGAGMILYGVLVQDWGVVTLGLVPLLFAGAARWWEASRSKEQSRDYTESI